MGFFDVSERWAENYSGRIAVEESNGYRITYREMAEVIRNHTGFYQDLQYDRIAVLGAASFAWFAHAYSDCTGCAFACGGYGDTAKICRHTSSVYR